MEELDQDSLYFFSKSKLTDRNKYKQKLNSAHAVSSTEKNLWTGVEKETIFKLQAPSAYLTDFQMFEYSVLEYVDSLGIIL